MVCMHVLVWFGVCVYVCVGMCVYVCVCHLGFLHDCSFVGGVHGRGLLACLRSRQRLTVDVLVLTAADLGSQSTASLLEPQWVCVHGCV